MPCTLAQSRVARNLGFNPHEDYAAASQIFGDVQATDCSRRFEYGHDGKPYYISGPHESATQVRTIVEQIERRLGPGNFDYLVLDKYRGESKIAGRTREVPLMHSVTPTPASRIL